MKTLTYWTNFEERRYLYECKDGSYSLLEDQEHGSFSISGFRVMHTDGALRTFEVGELTANSKELLNELS